MSTRVYAITPLGLTLRELLTQTDRNAILDELGEMHRGDQVSMRDAYANVITTLLAKPSHPPIYPILVNYCPPFDWSVYHIDDTVDPESVNILLWNDCYVEPPAGLTPEYGRFGKPPSDGAYDAGLNCYQHTLSMSFTPWDSLIDSPILWNDEPNARRLCPTNAHVAAQILWEITFHGYEESEVKAKGDELFGMVAEIRAELDREKGNAS